MSGEERRGKIIQALKNSDKAVSATTLAKEFDVSRQVIVQDVALLRANGKNIFSTNRGYLIQEDEETTRVFKVQHEDDEVEKELTTIVDLGGTVEDVFVYHKVYGVLRAEMNIKSRMDIRNYMQEIRSGKSSLLNAVARREAVIVSDIAGTTRDAIDIHLDLKGYPVIFTDTAGLREAEEEIEKKGIEIAYSKIQDADLVVCLFDASKDSVHIFDNIKKSFKNKTLFVANKSDELTFEQRSELNAEECLVISAKQHEGVSALLDKITEEIAGRFTSNSGLLITRRRYREALQNTLDNLAAFDLNKEIELSAEDIRLAARELGKITGRIEVDEILDKIFGSFCIGK